MCEFVLNAFQLLKDKNWKKKSNIFFLFGINWSHSQKSQMHQLDQMMLHEAVMLEIYRQALSAR